jgi:hypothetical protein
MDLKRIIKSHYAFVCRTQRGFEHDTEMVKMFAREIPYSPGQLKSWMYKYGLWQGIPDDNRELIVNAIPEILNSLPDKFDQANRSAFTRSAYQVMFSGLYDSVNRNWLSASSKLLWCKYPADFIIFDAFVERAIIVMQWFDDHLVHLPRLGAPPKSITPKNISEYIDFYMRYNEMVFRLFVYTSDTLNECRTATNEPYPYDIRIFDKILWLTANRNAVDA